MAVVIEKATGRDVVAREVTPTSRTQISVWLHSTGNTLFDLASAPDGSWIALLDAPTVVGADEFWETYERPPVNGGGGV